MDAQVLRLKRFRFRAVVTRVQETWQQQYNSPLTDVILVVLISPADTSDYIAFGQSRLYWCDNHHRHHRRRRRRRHHHQHGHSCGHNHE